MTIICQTALIMQCLWLQIRADNEGRVIILSSPNIAIFTLSQINKQLKERCSCSATVQKNKSWLINVLTLSQLSIVHMSIAFSNIAQQLLEPRTTYNVNSIPGHTIEGESHSHFRHRKSNWKNVLPLTGRSVLISVRRHAANTHTHIKLTWKRERERERSQCWGPHLLHSICSSFYSQ